MRATRSIVLAASLTLLSSPGWAYSTIYSFGDSLSDVGNIYAATGGSVPIAPYYQGRFSNGPNWVDDLSAKLGLGAVTASANGGNDFAVGGAQSGTTLVHSSTPLVDLDQQIKEFHLANSSPAANALYTLDIGANDIGADLSAYASNSITSAQLQTSLGDSIDNTFTAVSTLFSDGARSLIFYEVPDLSKVPAFEQSGSLGGELAQQFNNGVLQLLAPLESQGLKVYDLPMFSNLDAIVADPAAYGLSNVTTPCFSGNYDTPGTECANPAQSLFWDTEHPTAAAHAITAEVAYNLLNALAGQRRRRGAGDARGSGLGNAHDRFLGLWLPQLADAPQGSAGGRTTPPSRRRGQPLARFARRKRPAVAPDPVHGAGSAAEPQRADIGGVPPAEGFAEPLAAGRSAGAFAGDEHRRTQEAGRPGVATSGPRDEEHRAAGVGGLKRKDQASPDFQRPQPVRHGIGGRRAHIDRVGLRQVLSDARTRPDLDLWGVGERVAGPPSDGGVDLIGDHPPARPDQFRKDRGIIAGAGADMDHDIPRGGRERIDCQRVEGRLSVVDPPLGVDGHEHVVVNPRRIVFDRHAEAAAHDRPRRRTGEDFARNRSEGGFDPRVPRARSARDPRGIGAPQVF